MADEPGKDPAGHPPVSRAVRWAAVVKAVRDQLGPDAEPIELDGDEHVLLIAEGEHRVRYRLDTDAEGRVTAFLLLGRDDGGG